MRHPFLAFLVSLSAMAGIAFPAQRGLVRPAITGISHMAVFTTNPAAADYFYAHDLGAVKMNDPENRAGVRYYFSPVQFIEVLPLPPGDTSISRLDHVAYVTTSAEKLREYLDLHHVHVPDTLHVGSDGSRWFSVLDPEGNRIQFVQSPPPARQPKIPDNLLSHHIIHIGYLVHSQSAEDGFYREILGFRPYWYGGHKAGVVDWISQQVPDGTDWLEYMLVKGSATQGIPPGMSQGSLGVLDHFSLGVGNMEKAINLLSVNSRLNAKHNGPQIGRDGKWQFNLYDPDGIRVELMEFQPIMPPCCSPFTAASPLQ